MKQMDWTKIGKQVLLSAAVTAVSGVLLCSVLALLVSKEVLAMGPAKLMAEMLVNGVLLLVCFLTARKLPQSRLPASLAVAAVFWLLCLLAKALAFSEMSLTADWRMALPLLSSVAAGVLASQRKSRRR